MFQWSVTASKKAGECLPDSALLPTRMWEVRQSLLEWLAKFRSSSEENQTPVAQFIRQSQNL